jgi:hypothetical protein
MAKGAGNSFDFLLALLREESTGANTLQLEKLHSHLVIEVLHSPLRNLLVVRYFSSAGDRPLELLTSSSSSSFANFILC